MWARADTILWLDFSRARVMSRLVPRTLRRLFLRQELWNGNKEPWSNLYSLDPEKNVMVWSWTRHETNRRRYEAAERDPRLAHLRFVRLRSDRQVSDFLAGL